VGKVGPKSECLAYMKEVWTDMRPLSLRKKMEEMEKEKKVKASADSKRKVNRSNLISSWFNFIKQHWISERI